MERDNLRYLFWKAFQYLQKSNRKYTILHQTAKEVNSLYVLSDWKHIDAAL